MYSELHDNEGLQAKNNVDSPVYPVISAANGISQAGINGSNKKDKNEYDNDPEDIDEGGGLNGNLNDNNNRNRAVTYDYEPGSGYRRILPDFGCCKCFYSVLWYFLMGFPCAIVASIGFIITVVVIWIFNPCNAVSTIKHIKSIVIAEWAPNTVRYRYVIRDTAKQRLCVQYSNVLWILFSFFLGIVHLFLSIGFMFTIVFIPIGMIHYNMAQITLFPFNIELLVQGNDDQVTNAPNNRITPA